MPIRYQVVRRMVNDSTTTNGRVENWQKKREED